MEKLTDQLALDVIQKISGDDFCEDLDLQDLKHLLEGDLKTAHDKLSLIYMISHSMVLSNTCNRVHGSWRDLTVETAKKMGLI